MGKPIGQYKDSVTRYISEGFYRLRFEDVKVIGGDLTSSGSPYVVCGMVAINEGLEQGKRTELGFSCSENSESIAKAWFLALGFKESDCPPVEDEDEMDTFMRRQIGAIVECDLAVESNPKGYKQNKIDPPWAITAVETQEGDLKSSRKDDQPPF